MTIEYLDSKRITMLSTSSESLLTSSDYTSGNFTTVGSTVAITNNSVVFTNTPTNADNGQYKQITALAESDSYTLNFKLNISAHATFDNYFLYLSNTSGNPDASNALKIQTQGGSYNRFTFGTRLSGTNSEAQSSNNTASTGTDYYCTVTSDGSTATFKAWTNFGRTGTASVTLTKSITGIGTLNYIQHRTRNSGDSNTWSGTVSEVALSKTLDKQTNVQDNSILVEKDTAKKYWFSVESTSSPVSHSGGTSGTIDASGIDCNGSNPRGGWGQQVKTGHPLVGKSLKTLTVSTRFSLEPANRVDRDMTVKVFAGLNTATIRGTSDAISTSTLITAGTYYEKTFTFATPVPISADDCILVCIDGITGTTRSWNCKIRDGTNEDNGKGYWVTFNSANFPPSNAVQTNRSMIYTATYVTPATWTEV